YEVARPVHEKFRSPVQRRPPSVRLQWKLLSFGYFDRLSYVYQILQNAEAAAPFVEGNQINYPQIFRGVTVRYTCGANRLKEEIVFSQAAREALPDPAQLGLAADHTYLVFAAEFNLSPNNLNALAHRAGGRDPIRIGNGFAFEGESRIDFEDERENLYFFFPHDYAWAVNDSVSEPAKVRRVFYTQQGKNHLLIGVPWRWVRAAAPGPLLIDPTIYNDYANDTRLQSATNVGSETTLMVGKKSGQVKKRTIIKFDLQYLSIPSNATVLNAQMQLYYFNATVAGGSAWVDRWVQAHELLKSWHELQADSSERLDDIPWLAPRGKIGPGNNPITVDANGQFESKVLFQQGEHPAWKSWDLTNLTQKWVKTPSSNHGVILWATNEDVNAYDLRFYSSEHENKPPQLMIIWSNQPKTVYFLKDHLGSIRATVLDSAGAPVVAYDDYDPWGYLLAGRTKKRTWSDSQAVAKNKFTGKEWDDDYGVNWLFFPARSYDPEIARWLVRDPWAHKYPSWSPYIYALNNPMLLIDPDGRGVIYNNSGRQIVAVGGTTINNKTVFEAGKYLPHDESTFDPRREPLAVVKQTTIFDFYAITAPDGKRTWYKVSDWYFVTVEKSGEPVTTDTVILPEKVLDIKYKPRKLQEGSPEHAMAEELLKLFEEQKRQEKAKQQEQEKRQREEEQRKKQEEEKRNEEKRQNNND
ncbi:RHS repeat-associated core domain-containing protein, partial [candidate division KSB1 bacterium]|nr:RHS repeat-associated core domain-containing protein [candidate division KSB1 bacterium]